jgi:hypothetical protein
VIAIPSPAVTLMSPRSLVLVVSPDPSVRTPVLVTIGVCPSDTDIPSPAVTW